MEVEDGLRTADCEGAYLRSPRFEPRRDPRYPEIGSDLCLCQADQLVLHVM